jgi:hypothetical protein
MDECSLACQQLVQLVLIHQQQLGTDNERVYPCNSSLETGDGQEVSPSLSVIVVWHCPFLIWASCETTAISLELVLGNF